MDRRTRGRVDIDGSQCKYNAIRTRWLGCSLAIQLCNTRPQSPINWLRKLRCMQQAGVAAVVLLWCQHVNSCRFQHIPHKCWLHAATASHVRWCKRYGIISGWLPAPFIISNHDDTTLQRAFQVNMVQNTVLSGSTLSVRPMCCEHCSHGNLKSVRKRCMELKCRTYMYIMYLACNLETKRRCDTK